jgi:hypothetical protein
VAIVITVRRSGARVRTVRNGQQTLSSFDDPEGFRSLEGLREEELAPGAEFRFLAARNVEILTYVWRGGVVLENAGGSDVVLETGECHRSAVRAGAQQSGTNGSRVDPARLFLCVIAPDRNLLQAPAEKRRLSLAERRGVLRLLGSRTGRDSSLRLRQDACIYSSLLDRGQHLIHELAPGRGAWLHVVSGRVQLVDQQLETGDGASIVDEPAVSLTARESAEVLLFDVV